MNWWPALAEARQANHDRRPGRRLFFRFNRFDADRAKLYSRSNKPISIQPEFDQGIYSCTWAKLILPGIHPYRQVSVKFKAIFYLLGCCLVSLGNSEALAREKLYLATGEWPPYTSKKLTNYGMAAEIVSAVVHDMGMEPVFRFYPWKRAQSMVLSGKVFGAFPYSRTSARAEKFDFSDDFFPSSDFKIFYKRDHSGPVPTWDSDKDLRDYRVGVVSGSWYVPRLETAGIKLKRLNSDKQVFQMLNAHRIDIAITEERVGWWYINKLYPDQAGLFGVFDKSFASKNDPGGVMISRAYPNSANLRESFNRSLQRIKDNGVYESIISKYSIPRDRS